MARKVRTRVSAPVAPEVPAGITTEAPMPVPVEPSPPPAPVQEREQEQERDARSSLAAATGTDDTALQCALLRDLLAALAVKPGSESSEQRGAAGFALMREFKPQDGLEGAFAAQAAALHAAGMQALSRAARPEMPVEVSSRLRRDAVLAFRAMGEVVETIQTKRGGGAVQRITVEHISQAIIGVPGGGGRE